MEKSNKDYDSLFDEIIIEIAEEGKSARDAIKGKMSTQTFYVLLEDEEKSKRYARATEMRAEVMANETLTISDSKGTDVNRDRLRVDTRKWLLSKLQPKKYGDKLDIEHSGNIVLNFDHDDKSA